MAHYSTPFLELDWDTIVPSWVDTEDNPLLTVYMQYINRDIGHYTIKPMKALSFVDGDDGTCFRIIKDPFA